MLKDQTYFNYLTARKTGTPEKRDLGHWTLWGLRTIREPRILWGPRTQGGPRILWGARTLWGPRTLWRPRTLSGPKTLGECRTLPGPRILRRTHDSWRTQNPRRTLWGPTTPREPRTLWRFRILWRPRNKEPRTYKPAKVSWFSHHVINFVEFKIEGRFIYHCWMQINLTFFVKLKIC